MREVEGICEKIKIDFEHRAKLKIRRKKLDYWQYQYQTTEAGAPQS
jgi:hypothetical protein